MVGRGGIRSRVTRYVLELRSSVMNKVKGLANCMVRCKVIGLGSGIM